MGSVNFLYFILDLNERNIELKSIEIFNCCVVNLLTVVSFVCFFSVSTFVKLPRSVLSTPYHSLQHKQQQPTRNKASKNTVNTSVRNKSHRGVDA